MTTAENIKKARKNAGLTQKELGIKLGVSAAMIAQYESKKRKPKIDTIQKIATALNISIGELLSGNFSDYGQEITKDFAEGLIQNVHSAIESGYKLLDDSKEALLISKYRELNSNGKTEAIKRVDELTEIKKYIE